MSVAAAPRKHTRPLKWEDLAIVEKALRPADRLELEAAGLPALDNLKRAYADQSLTNYAIISPNTGMPFGVFGVSTAGVVWLVSTPEINWHVKTFLRESRKWIDLFQEIHPVLWNWVDSRNTLHLKWLTKWLGFRITAEGEAYGNKYYKVERLTIKSQPKNKE